MKTNIAKTAHRIHLIAIFVIPLLFYRIVQLRLKDVNKILE